MPLWGRIVGIVVCGILLVLFVNPFFLGIHNAGGVVGTLASLLGAAFFLFDPVIAPVLHRIWEDGTGRVILCIVIGLLCVCGILAVVISVGMIRQMRAAPETETPVIVLGCKVRPDGPSLMLARRLNTAVTYLKAHPDVPVIVCGGQGKDEPMTEAQCMADYLTAHGIDAARITQEAASATTQENLRNACDILDAHEWGRDVTIITDGYHQLRASMIGQEAGLHCSAVSAPTSWYLVPTYWVREWLGVCYQVVLG